jgi:hypothetical protein
MIILGLLLILGAAGLSMVAIWANQGAFEASAGTVELMGYQATLTNGDVFLAGATAGAVALLGVFLLFSGIGRRARRRSVARRQLREQQQELRETQRRQEAAAAEAATTARANEKAALTEEKAEVRAEARAAKRDEDRREDREDELVTR